MNKARFSAAVVAIVALASTIATAWPGSATPAPKLAVHASFLDALAPCGADASCAREAIARTVAPLAGRIESLPSGRAGIAGWTRLAASLSGARIEMPPIAAKSLPDAILGLYAQIGHEVDAALAAQVRAQAARLDAAYARSVARVVEALRVSTELSARATRGSGLAKLIANPARAMRLVGYATAAPGSVNEAFRAEALETLAILDRIDGNLMATAAAVMADALASFTPAASAQDDVDLPFIFVGGEGDNTHTQDRLLSIDMSGNDTYLNNAGGGLFTIAGGTLAADLGAGNDVYDKPNAGGAQGWGTGAPGMLYDEGGTDSYRLWQFGQGSAVGGVGVLYDAGDADDVYVSAGSDPIGTKAAALGGIGMLVDENGDDYIHQDGLDGFDWGAAGLAIMANLGAGDDTYRADEIDVPDPTCLEEPCPLLGRFAGPVQVSAEANGAAILYEEGGNDRYTCGLHVRQGCQGAAGGGSFALLWERGGNDAYSMGDSFSEDFFDGICGDLGCDSPSPLEHPVFPMGQGAGYQLCAPCTPPALGILFDEDGADSYTAARWAQGYGTFGGLGILLDNGADTDAYNMQAPLNGARANGQSWVDGLLGIGADQ